MFSWVSRKKNKGFTVTIVNRGIPGDMNNVVYTFQGGISPEDVAKILVRFATGIEYPTIQKALEEAGHQSVGQRMNYVYNAAMESLVADVMGKAMSRPRQQQNSESEDGAPVVSPSASVNLR